MPKKPKMPTVADVTQGASTVTTKDVESVLERESEIKAKLQGPLARFVEDVNLLFALVKAWWNKEYTEIPWQSIAAIVFALLYVVSPIDFIPDMIPVIGLLDDAAVIAICLSLVEGDLHTFKDWRDRQAKV